MSLTPDIERVLSEHLFVARPDGYFVCACKQTIGDKWYTPESALEPRHRLHLAEQIAALVEQREETAGREALLGAASAMGRRARDERAASHWRAFAWANWLRARAGEPS